MANLENALPAKHANGHRLHTFIIITPHKIKLLRNRRHHSSFLPVARFHPRPGHWTRRFHHHFHRYRYWDPHYSKTADSHQLIRTYIDTAQHAYHCITPAYITCFSHANANDKILWRGADTQNLSMQNISMLLKKYFLYFLAFFLAFVIRRKLRLRAWA